MILNRTRTRRVETGLCSLFIYGNYRVLNLFSGSPPFAPLPGPKTIKMEPCAGDRRSTQYTSPHNCSSSRQKALLIYNLVSISASPNSSRLRPGSSILGPACQLPGSFEPGHGSRTAGVGAFGTYARAFVFCQGFSTDPCPEAGCPRKSNLSILVMAVIMITPPFRTR